MGANGAEWGILAGEFIDPVEYVRGQISALSYITATNAREVHILRLRSAFARAGIVQKLRYALSVLNLMREIEDLGRGYWFPTPLRVVSMPEHSILVAPLPTAELQRHFPSVMRAGYARVCDGPDAAKLPKQEMDAWLGMESYDAVTWIEHILGKAVDEMGSTLHSGAVQFFGIESSSAASTVIKPEWKKDLRQALVSKGRFVLCRERVTREYSRHFVGKISGTRLVAEGPTLYDTPRAQFGFAALCGKPLTVVVIAQNEDYIFHLPLNLPRSERQLMLALGLKDVAMGHKGYRVSNKFLTTIRPVLHRLGCEVRVSGV